MEKILITGATGPTGNNAIAKLLELKIPVRALVHKIDDRSAALAAPGLEIIEGDLTDFNSVSAAMKGISKAYFVYPVTVPGILEATAYFAQAALEEKVSLIVNMSQRTVGRDVESHGSQNHWIAERLFDHSGVPVTHLRPTLFHEWIIYFAKEIRDNNRLILPFGNSRYAPIAGEDIGRVIATILARPDGHAGQTYDLYGPAEITQYEVATMLSNALGRTITYVPMEIDDFSAVLKPLFSPYFVQHIAAIARGFRADLFNGHNDMVEELTGQKPLPMEAFIKKNITLFN